MDKETMPWERQKGESHKAFEAFHEYCLLGNTRNLRSVASKLNKSLALIGRWSSFWNWQERVREYDNELIRQEMQEQRDEIKKMRQRQVEYGLFLQNQAMKTMMARAREDDGKGLQFEKLADLMNLFEKGSALEEHARTEGLREQFIEPGTNVSNGITVERRIEVEKFFSDEYRVTGEDTAESEIQTGGDSA